MRGSELKALAIFPEAGSMIDETGEGIALINKRDNLHVEMGTMAKELTQQQSAVCIDDYCKDLGEWPGLLTLMFSISLSKKARAQRWINQGQTTLC